MMLPIFQFILITLLALVGLVVDRSLGLMLFFPMIVLYGVWRAQWWGEYLWVLMLTLLADVYWQLPLGLIGVVVFGVVVIRQLFLPRFLPRWVSYLFTIIFANLFLFAIR